MTPLIKTCANCRLTFEVYDEDLAFYERMSPTFAGKKFPIPAPTLCPTCRWQRRLSFRNERSFYHGTCALTGRSMISMHHPDAPFPVYHITEWLSDKWNPLDYGCDFDFNRPFFEQFKEMCDRIPHFNLFVDPHMDINSDYTNCSSEAKNCYMISNSTKNEDCLYSRGLDQAKDCVDCLRVQNSELCYECTDVSYSYRCSYSQDLESCSDCYFSSNLKACKNCFGCDGLIQKEYYFFNEALSKEEWLKRVAGLRLTPKKISELMNDAYAVRLKSPQRAVRQTQCENTTGDKLINCKNSHHCFDSNNLEDCAYCYEVPVGAKSCYDYSMWGLQAELLYECNGCGYNVYNTLFTNQCWQNISDVLYCNGCFPSVKNCFGCFGLRRAQYCILNKQYSKEEYEILVARILEHMQKTGEWGEFFPISSSPFAYNETVAQILMPVTKDKALSKGWAWYEKELGQESYIGPEVNIPELISDVSDSITTQILRCKKTGKLYKVIPQELNFYRKMNLPVPLVAPEQRLLDRVARRNPRYLWPRTCSSCSSPIQTSYAPDRPEKVLCEACYLKAVY